MQDLYDQIVSQRGTLRNWMDKVPGLRGYLDKGDRRIADRMIREHVQRELESRVQRFVGIERDILRMDGGMSYMTATNEAKSKLQTYISKVGAAAPGYSGFFAAVKVDEAAMDRLYAFDEAQIRYVDLLDERLAALEAAVAKSDGVEGAIREVYKLANEAIEAFALREDVLTQLNSQYSA